MQMAVLEFARNVAGIPKAESVEMVPKTEFPVIDLMEDQKRLTSKGGTMRLGAYQCRIERGSLAFRIYGKQIIQERHRHRYELNDYYMEILEKAGMRASGKNPETGLVEIVEVPSHPFYIGVQFHPELKSTPEKLAPLFRTFIGAALKYQERKKP